MIQKELTVVTCMINMPNSSRRKFLSLSATTIAIASIPSLLFASNKERLIFLHIPKAAGVSLNHNIIRNINGAKMQLLYSPPYEIPVKKDRENTFWAKSQDKLDSYEYIMGHINFGVHKNFTQPSKYISVLRHPISRISSAYHYYEFNKHMSIPAFLQKGFAEADNGMVRRLSGIGQEAEIGSITQDSVDLAIKNIEQHFALIGTLEHYNEFLLMLGKLYHWNLSPKIKQNVTTSHPNHVSNLTDDDKSAILEHNQYDLKLHEYVTRSFKQTFKEHATI